MNYIRINPKLHKIKSGGGTPVLVIPKSIANLKELRDKLEKIKYFHNEELAFLTHKKINSHDAIPASSRRFIKSIKFLFSDNKKNYHTTYFDEEQKKLIFVYSVTYAEITDVKLKIDKTIEFLKQNTNENMGETFESLFCKNNALDWITKIKKFKLNNDLDIFSISSIKEILSRLETTYGNFYLPKKEILLKENEAKTIVFASVQTKNDSKNILEENRVQILFESNTSLDVKGNFTGKLQGFIYCKTIENIKPNMKSEYSKQLNKAIYKRFTQLDYHSENVGVIDGGVSLNSIIFKDLESYHSNQDMFFQPNPKGTHAEEISSILLFSKNIVKINDNLPRPKVHLFNVICDNDSIYQIKNKIQKIIESYGKEIKLWNFSIIFPNIKNSNVISNLGVFLDKIQKQHNVIFVVPTGNIIKESPSAEIESPSGSYLSLSVSAVKSNFQKTSYSKKGYKKYVPSKPDVAIFGGDKNDEFPVVSSNCIKWGYGTSYAVALAVRKLSYLVSCGLTILEAVAVLINYAHYFMHKNNINSDNYNGHGVLPIKTQELLELKNKKALIVMTIDLKTDYKQGVLDIFIPQTKTGMFDFSYFISINTNVILEKNETFEYVLDAARIVFGKVYNENIYNWKADDRMIDKDNDLDLAENAIESYLRTYKGKFKNRDTFKKELKKSIKNTFIVDKQKYNINKWGIKITRNSLLSTGRKAKMQTSICLIIESKSINDFMHKFIIKNKNIIVSKIPIELENIELDKNEIKFI